MPNVQQQDYVALFISTGVKLVSRLGDCCFHTSMHLSGFGFTNEKDLSHAGYNSIYFVR
jgi:hypothetical protein